MTVEKWPRALGAPSATKTRIVLNVAAGNKQSRTPQARRGKDPQARRTNQRMAELRAVHRFIPRFCKVSWEEYFRRLTNSCAGRDPATVPSTEISKMLALTLALKLDVENKETERRRANGRRFRKDGKPYFFRIVTMAPCDKTKQEIEQHYRKRADKERAETRKAQRAERWRARQEREASMQPMQHSTKQPQTFADYMAARKATTKAQCEAILEVVGTSEWRASELPNTLRRDPAWRTVEAAKLDRTVHDRLDMLRAQGRIADRHEPGPRGSSLRIVWCT